MNKVTQLRLVRHEATERDALTGWVSVHLESEDREAAAWAMMVGPVPEELLADLACALIERLIKAGRI